MRKLRHHPKVGKELIGAAAFFEQQEVGLGNCFLDEVETQNNQIMGNPQTWQQIREKAFES